MLWSLVRFCKGGSRMRTMVVGRVNAYPSSVVPRQAPQDCSPCKARLCRKTRPALSSVQLKKISAAPSKGSGVVTVMGRPDFVAHGSESVGGRRPHPERIDTVKSLSLSLSSSEFRFVGERAVLSGTSTSPDTCTHDERRGIRAW